jgi:hypothetical protein
MANIKLTVIPGKGPNDSTFHFTENPGFIDDGTDNLLCGSCGDVLAKGANGPQILKKMRPAGGRLVYACAKCKSLNVVA